MSHMISLTQLVDLAKSQGLDEAAEAFTDALEPLVETLGAKVADHFGVQCQGFANEQEAFGGLGADFGPSEDDQPCPVELAECDPHSDWAMNHDGEDEE